MKKNHENNKIAIKVENLSKTFKIPHEKVDTLRGAFVSALKKTSYEEFKALDDVSFEVEKGEFFGIIGRNGSGKSTLLKILADIYVPDAGKVEINGRISPFLELGIGFNPELSGRDNIYLNGSVLGLTKKQIDEKFDSIVKFSELERFIDQRLKNYSSGMEVRLAFSVAIHANRDILLMDEVLAVGDGNFQSKCLGEFKKYKDMGKAVVLVTHDVKIAQDYCDRMLLLRKGEIDMVGEPEKVVDRYIHQNMSGKEKKPSKNKSDNVKTAEKKQLEAEKIKDSDEKQKENSRVKIKNKPQSIVDIEVKDANKKELMTTSRGNNFFVDVMVDIKKLRKGLHLAVQVFDRDTNCFISGNNTQVDNFDCNWERGSNKITLSFDKHYLNKGNFYIKAVLFEYDPSGNIFLDEFSTLEKNYFFVSELKNSGWGTVYLNHKWKKGDEK